MEIGYYAIFFKDEPDEEGFNVDMPDVKGFATFGYDEENSIEMARECLYALTYDMPVCELPKASTKEEIEKKAIEIDENDQRDYGWKRYGMKIIFVSYETSEYTFKNLIKEDDNCDDLQEDEKS